MVFTSIFLSALFAANTVLSQTVTITRDIPPREHDCIENCLFRPYNRRVDVGDVLQCAAPYEEQCYCPAENSQAEMVSRHIDSCATESCSRGDLTQDIDKMRAYYATYCHQKGFTADLVEEWYSALDTVVSTSAEATTTTATSQTQETGSASSTTRAVPTVATETASTTAAAAAPTETDPNRNPDGLPKWDLDGTSTGTNAAAVATPGVLLLGLAGMALLG